MANIEGVTFGDFDFHNSDAVLYRDLFGRVATTAFSRVQFPWDYQSTAEAAYTTDNHSTNADTVYRPVLHDLYRQEEPIHTGSDVHNNTVRVSPTGAQAAFVGPMHSHVSVQATDVIPRQSFEGFQQLATNVIPPQSYVGFQQPATDGNPPQAYVSLQQPASDVIPPQSCVGLQQPDVGVPPHGDNQGAVYANHHLSGVPEPTGSFQESPKTDSLKRRKKKQRDPSYYDNFYKNPEVRGHASNQKSGDFTLANDRSSGPTAVGDNSYVGSPLGRTAAPVDPTVPASSTQLAPDRAVRNQSVVQTHSFSGPSYNNDQLDHRTRGIKSEPPYPIVQQIYTTSSSEPPIVNNAYVDSISSSQSFPTSSTLPTSSPAASIVPPDDRHQSVQQSPDERKLSDSTPGIQEPAVGSLSSTLSSVSDQQLESLETRTPQDAQVGASAVNSQTEPENRPESLNDNVRPSEGQTVPASAPNPSPWGNKATSWAGLFQKEGQNSTVIHVVDNQSASQPPIWEKKEASSEPSDPVTADADPQIKKLGEYLKKVSINNKPMFIQPRGLINVANNCYINSILQVIVACPPFYHLFQHLPLAVRRRGPSSTPMLDAILDLCKQFEEKPFGNRKIRPGEPFEPVEVYQMLRRINTTLSIKQGKQEDAEEFLSCLLNGFHDEMIAAMEALDGPKPTADDPPITNGVATDHGEKESDEWEQVGPKKKATITRVAEFTKSPIYNIFGGQMRSALHQHGARESATLQPFFTLQLDIQSPQITSVKKALENFGTKEAVHGFMSNKTKTEVEASKRTSLEELPPVLILHLKQFVYDMTGGCQKLTKKMDYDMDLEISKDLLSPSGKAKIHPGQRNFKLFAVIYHTGKEASGGHYISDYFHVGIGGWIRADDNLIKTIKPVHVLNPPSGFTPYLLVYRRRDIPSTNLSNKT